MGRHNDKSKYPFDNQLSLDDFLFGANADNLDRSQNYPLRGIFSTFKTALNLASLEYIFAGGSDADLDENDQGYFTTNSNNTLAASITTINFNKDDLNGIDISSLVTTVSGNVSSFVIRLSKPSATGQVFYFAIDAITDQGDYYEIDVTNFVGGNSLVDETTYNLTFDLAGIPATLTESDPVFAASVAADINTTNINQWNTAYGWGDHSLVGYLTSESDPVFLASDAADITSGDITQWDAAYSWGNHASAGYELQSNKGIANGYVPLNSSVKIDETYLPDSILGQVEYQGTWNANTNTPDVGDPTLSKGHYYVVSTGGTYLSIDYAVGDWIISNGTSWEKVDNTDAVTSFNGRLGNITPVQSDYESFFVLKSGDTMTGDLVLNDNVSLSLGTSGGESSLYSNGNHTFLDMSNGSFFIRQGTTQRFLFASNGDLSVDGQITANGQTVWNEGNDGAGSGLDSDLLDGFHGTQYLRSDVDDQLNATLYGLDGNPLIQVFGGDTAYLGSTVRDNVTLASINEPNWRDGGGVDRRIFTEARDIEIVKQIPSILLSSSVGTAPNYPKIDFKNTANQGVSLYHTHLDSELPVAGYGLVFTADSTNTQFPSTGVLTFNVLGEIYAGATSLANVHRVVHEGMTDVTFSDIGDVTLTLAADTDNSDETHNPAFIMTQDGGGFGVVFAVEGNAGQSFTGSLQNYVYHRAISVNQGFQWAAGTNEIATLSNTGNFTVDGEMTADDFNLSSDRRLKENIEDIIIDEPLNIRWRSFTLEGVKKYGVIADETKDELVSKRENGFDAVAYHSLYALAFAEKDKQIKELTERLDRLEKIITNGCS